MLDFTETSDLKDLEKFQITADLMKKNVLSAADPLPESFPGRCYYFSNDGCDSNDGFSPETPLKNLEMVEKLPLERGDAVLFRRGDVFRGGVNCNKDGITFSAWGNGDKPVICGSRRNYADNSIRLNRLWQTITALGSQGIMPLCLLIFV